MKKVIKSIRNNTKSVLGGTFGQAQPIQQIKTKESNNGTVRSK
jgi:hypothetical protein